MASNIGMMSISLYEQDISYDQKQGKISNPNFLGIGLRFAGYGFDFGYTYGEPGHPLTNTMRFSLNMEY